MIVITDNKEYADSAFTNGPDWLEVNLSRIEPNLRYVAERLFSNRPIHQATAVINGCWRYAFLVKDAPASQYDLMVECSGQQREFPDGIICLAGSGRDFHGQRGRPWDTRPGNIHLTAYLSPNRPIEHFHIGFSLLAAVSVIDTIDSLEPLAGRAQIKWVNDILINGAKVAGFLANTTSLASTVTSAVLGIGLNVETTPQVPADDITPSAASLRDFAADSAMCHQKGVLNHLLAHLDTNYRLLLSGQCDRLLAIYRERSLVIGRHVTVVSDAPNGRKQHIAAGRVQRIGDNLELFLEGVTEPVTR
ncbi:MAG: biotin--[acetyl-CoA-carboxylase] ligase, partial [Candidatus Latescibacterota bacterium]